MEQEGTTRKEVEHLLMTSEDEDLNLYQQFLSKLKSVLVEEDSLLSGQTKRSVEVLRNILREDKVDCLFVCLQDDIEMVISKLKE